ncbi:hypothetical protein [Paractinoplanes brasiliensis]|uniref:Uncharacterized protein n=1 Tax=Paractinoplanes brasiliensis TaxID=52695 RepID=A0A4R6JXB8_9ACTN|nr:hypothetical protein [Actinoplanes brasiliensis]TDO41359.1 hypothetical protein C8E87_5091 [Actinoplanes brasiliensis]GID27358.1 hypothetical protein Abr02nite_23410 [Actinoplanes brasiliensis]
MTEMAYTSAGKVNYRRVPCPACGKRRELGWANAGSSADTDRWLPIEKCRNRECAEFKDPTSLAG